MTRDDEEIAVMLRDLEAEKLGEIKKLGVPSWWNKTRSPISEWWWKILANIALA
jgi:hypothetical protein